jgi:hypothetical protein
MKKIQIVVILILLSIGLWVPDYSQAAETFPALIMDLSEADMINQSLILEMPFSQTDRIDNIVLAGGKIKGRLRHGHRRKGSYGYEYGYRGRYSYGYRDGYRYGYRDGYRNRYNRDYNDYRYDRDGYRRGRYGYFPYRGDFCSYRYYNRCD